MKNVVYEVWGGDEDQEEGSHFADFDTLSAAKRYVNRCCKENARLILHISERER